MPTLFFRTNISMARDLPTCTTATTVSTTPTLNNDPGTAGSRGRSNEMQAIYTPTRGSFTPGVRIMSGGPSREVSLQTKITNPGTVLFSYPDLKPDRSGEPRTNAIRPDERFGSRVSFIPGAMTFRGGCRRTVPPKAKRTKGIRVLFTSTSMVLKPDMSGAARSNVEGGRPDERLGDRGSFTRGVRAWQGGEPRNVPRKLALSDGSRGTVLLRAASFTNGRASGCMPDMSGEAETNVAGGRADERCGRYGGFEHGVVQASGGPLRMTVAASDASVWREAGQRENKFRRCAPSHFLAGVSILSGGMPVY